MRSILNLFLITILLFSCKNESKKLPVKNTKNNFIGSQYFILEYGAKNEGRKDTLFVNFNLQDVFLIWKKDTIAKENSFDNATGFISSLGTLGCKNTFLMEIYEG